LQNQNVINFAPAQNLLTRIWENKRQLDDLIDAQAQMLYRARALWIGGQCLPWGLLSNGQREGYRAEIHDLIKKAKGEQ
jgi:hypothetical protein